ncbi:hypothetical protein AN958_02189 [Leucoagaricus sp. SymC.cos]|nr:hypothetical protein AN958_02189 [Leucoagaricus sp. SymC.cos]
MPIRRFLVLGVLFSVLTLSILGLFFFDIDLPAELNTTLHKLKLSSPSPDEFNDMVDPIDHKLYDIGDASWDEVTSFPPPPPLHLDYAPGGPNSVISLSSSFKTTIPNGASVHGFSVLDDLIVYNGTFYIVTNNPTAFPSKDHLVQPPPPDHQGENAQDPNPETDIQFIFPDELVPLLGKSAMRIEGFSWINYDVPLFMNHYYHWWGEIILGGWRTYSLVGLDPKGTFHPERLRAPDRFLLPLVTDGKWRDKAGVNGPLMRAAFLRAPIEERDQWLDLIKLNSTIVFERAMIVNRRAAHAHPLGNQWWKMIAGTQELKAPEFSSESSYPSHEGFWSPLRKSLTHNLLGYLPRFASLTDRRILSPPSAKSDAPVVTYIVRQGTGRRLTEESHQSLVDALKELEKEGVCEVQIARMEDIPLREQFRLAARSTHYIVWNDTLITYAKGTYHKVPNIYVHGPSVAQKIKERLLGVEGDDTEKPAV